jgi:5-(carboxyamino)imidazole ribonucleotide synthase
VTQPILPGATIGVLGSGQLGRMFAIAARRMGYRVHTFSPDDDTPTGQVADRELRGAYDDLDAVQAFARNVNLVTFEFENIPAPTAAAAAEMAPVRPSGDVLYITQHRLREKTYLAEHGFPVVPYVPVRSTSELHAALNRLGSPAVLKTAGWGYDGKGQFKLTGPQDIERAWQTLGGGEAVLEAFVNFECEVSVVAARGLDGATADFGAVWNTHANHILDVTVAPADIEPRIAAQAREIAAAVVRQLDVVGVLCVEFFVTRDGRLLINELAPRPHNSGHFTVDACATSQFEQQLRAICGLGLGSTEMLRPAAMANLLGDLWNDGPPNWPAACRFPQVKLHLYGKETARPGRKMGHLTALADTSDEARRLVLAARAALTQRDSR